MPTRRTSAIRPEQFATFGQLLRFLRQRAGLTQRELSIAVGYSESQMSRLEQNQRAPDPAALAARFVPALHLETEPDWAARLLELGAASRSEGSVEDPVPAGETPLSPHNLPAQLTSFIGREAELAQVRQLLSGDIRLVTLTGPGGTGKTRLALEAAAGLLPTFPDGVWWVELAPLADPGLISQTAASVLGVREEADRPILDTLTDHLRGKRVLLILDNCEHLIQACARFAEVVLRACPQVCLLASSRELLGMSGERALSVPSLPTPEPNQALSLDNLRRYEAVRLFLDRAAATAPQFTLTAENAPAVVEICHRLDGIPLALELAAARLRMLPVEQLAARLDDAFRLLTGGSRTALPRHQTLQALIDWSYDLLPEAEQKLFCRLAAFAGGWTLEAAEAVCAGNGLEQATVAELLSRLIDKSLVQVNHQRGVARYQLMETVRQYAQAKLAVGGEADEARRRHAEYFLKFAEAAAHNSAETFPGWLDRVEPENDNLRAALGWSRMTPGHMELFVRLGRLMLGPLAALWGKRASLREAHATILANPGLAGFPADQAYVIGGLGQILVSRGDYRAGQAYLVESLNGFRKLGNQEGIAGALQLLGWVLREVGEAAQARTHLQESVAIYQALQEQLGVLGATNTLAETLIMEGQLKEAEALLKDNLSKARELGEGQTTGWALNHLGHIAQLRGDYGEAVRLHQASLPLFTQFGTESVGSAWAYQGLGETHLATGDLPSAAAHFTHALALARDIRNQEVLAWCLAGLAGVAALDEDPERAAWLWGAGEKLRLSLGVREAPCSQAIHERLKAQAREQIGEAAFAAHWAAGESVTLSEAIERALR